MFVLITEERHEAQNQFGKIISEIPEKDGCSKLYEIQILDNARTITCDELQFETVEDTGHCGVCNQSFEEHLLINCDGETCLYCSGKWDECSCGQ